MPPAKLYPAISGLTMVLWRLTERFRRLPPPGVLEFFLEVVEYCFHRGDEEAFRRVPLYLPWLCRAEGFLTDFVVILCRGLHSDNRVVVEGCLHLMEEVVKKHAAALGGYNVHRMTRGIASLQADPSLRARGYRLLVHLKQIDAEYVDDALARLQDSDVESVRERAYSAFLGMLST